jgi:hypothetical protein
LRLRRLEKMFPRPTARMPQWAFGKLRFWQFVKALNAQTVNAKN